MYGLGGDAEQTGGGGLVAVGYFQRPAE